MSDELKEQTKILTEMLKWIKFSGMKNVKETLLENLTDDTKILIYHYSDGINSIPVLKKLLGIGGNMVIPNLWNKWKNIGIMEKVSASGGERGKKIFNLEDFGISIPEVKKEEPKVEEAEKEAPVEKVQEENSTEEESKELNQENISTMTVEEGLSKTSNELKESNNPSDAESVEDNKEEQNE